MSDVSKRKRSRKLSILSLLLLCFAVLLPTLAFAQREERFPFVVPKDWTELPSHALIITTKGPFEIRFHRKQAPISVANFAYLAKQERYQGLDFHSYKEGFVVESGDLTDTSLGRVPWTLPPEMDPDIFHVAGTLGWTRTKNAERRSGGAEFYICLENQPNLDGFYSAFAVVVKGMDNVRRLRVGDKILKIKFPKKEPVGIEPAKRPLSRPLPQRR